MTKKKHRLLHSQISGIIWFSAILIAILVAVFFFFPQHRDNPQESAKEQKDIAILQKKEDSVYRARREKNASRKYSYPRGREKNLGRHVGKDSSFHYYTNVPPAPTRQPLVVELNSADSTTLQLLHGIGPAFARRIVRYRERLGGFSSTEQLLEVYGFTPELLEHIRPYLRLDADQLQKINVNSMTLKQLIKHPYMDYYFARDLVNLRSHGVTFTSPDDLRAIPSCSDTMLNRLLPYLGFQD